jgi:low affinity Fe/Cu permease
MALRVEPHPRSTIERRPGEVKRTIVGAALTSFDLLTPRKSAGVRACDAGTSLAPKGLMARPASRRRIRPAAPEPEPAALDDAVADIAPPSRRRRGRARRRANGKPPVLERFAHAATLASGSSMAFALALGVVVVWGITGPLFGFSDTWQLVINTGTTIVTFLMVFLIQRTQNKDSIAVQLKLNELVAAVEGASHRLINVEDLSEEELEVLHAYYCRLAKLAKDDGEIGASHSIEEAEENARARRERR